MRVGIDVRSLLERQPTGVGEYTLRIVRELLTQAPDIDFRLLASGFKKRALPDIGMESHPRVTLKWMERPNKLVSLSTASMQRPYLDEFLGGVDVFFSPNLNFSALSPRSAHVLTIHDLSFDMFPNFLSTKRRFWHSAVRAKTQAIQADHVICDSSSTAKDLVMRFGIERERISVIPLGVGKDFVGVRQSERERVAKLYGLTSPYILALGTIEPRKNLVVLINAFEEVAQRVPEVQLVLAGPRGWKTGPVFAALRTSQQRQRIKTIGYVEAKDRAALIANAAAVAAASTYEGFGLPALESMRVGTPVLTANNSSLPEVVQNAGIIVDPERPHEVAAGLIAILTDLALHAELSARGRRRALDLDWERAGRETLRVLTGVYRNHMASAHLRRMPTEVTV
jgi:glycosyltransferase involved in cell wall biosynthesis